MAGPPLKLQALGLDAVTPRTEEEKADGPKHVFMGSVFTSPPPITAAQMEALGESLLVPGHAHYATPVFEGSWRCYWEALAEEINKRMGAK